MEMNERGSGIICAGYIAICGEGSEGQPPGFLFNHFRRSDHGVDGDQVVSGFHGQRAILDRLRPRLSNDSRAF
jgi:hypothetical protein